MDQAERRLRESFGLTSYEARAYMSLVGRSLKAKDVSIAAAVPLPRVYDTLRGLEEKGFVRHEGDAFSGVAPSLALQARLLKRRRDLEEGYSAMEDAKESLVGLLGAEPRGKGPAEPVLLRGIDSIVAAFIDVLGRSDDVLIAVRKGLRVKGTFRSYLERLETAGKKMRLLVPSEPSLSPKERRFLAGLGIEVRVYRNPMLDIMVGDVSDVIVGVPDTSTDEPFGAVGLWMRDGAFAGSLRRALEETWRAAH